MDACYCEFLKSCDEPLLFLTPDKWYRHTYRIVAIRTFDPDICVRIDIGDDQSGHITKKIKPGNDIWEICEKHLMPREMDVFLTRLEEFNFWDFEERDVSRGGIDGETWILEGVRFGNYRNITCWLPADNTFLKLGKYLFETGDVEITPYDSRSSGE